jgi:predicted HicB family RNase H-like nuclease
VADADNFYVGEMKMMDGMQNNQLGSQFGQSSDQPVVNEESTSTVEQAAVTPQAPVTPQATVAPPAAAPIAQVSGAVLTLEEKKREAIQLALDIARQVSDWETFFRSMMGSGGVIEQLFPRREERSAFKRMPEYYEIQRIMARLREQLNKRSKPDREVTRVITVRLPESLHSALMLEANDMNTSMNKLCISKLLQVIDDELVC